MNRHDYYEQMKELARQTRAQHGLDSPRVLRSQLRAIYKHHGIAIDLWSCKFKKLRGAYFNDDAGPTVMLAKGLPEDPMVFTMAHELKHHLVDSGTNISLCSFENERAPIEIGAEVFAAELIFPEHEFVADLKRAGVQSGRCTAEDLVHLKRRTRTTLSYSGLAKRAELLALVPDGSLAGVKWKKLEERIYGVPFYKRLRR